MTQQSDASLGSSKPSIGATKKNKILLVTESVTSGLC